MTIAVVSEYPCALAASSHSAWLPTHAHPLLSVHNPDVRASNPLAGLAVGRKAVAQRASAAAMRWTCWTERRAERRIGKKKKILKKTTAVQQYSTVMYPQLSTFLNFTVKPPLATGGGSARRVQVNQ